MSSNVTENQESNEWKKRLIYIIEEMKKHKESKHFMHAVHEVNDAAPGYYEQIENPMNISQLEIELLIGVIKSPHDFLNKCSLIWDNATQYNGNNHPVTTAANKIKSIVMNLIKKQFSCDKRIIINPGNRRSSRIRKQNTDAIEHKEKEHDDHENGTSRNYILQNEHHHHFDAYHSPIFPLVSNDDTMPSLERESPELLPIKDELLHLPDDSKHIIHKKQIKQLNLRISELNEELKIAKHQNDNMKEQHDKEIRELRLSYSHLLNAFHTLKNIINQINGYILHQTNNANNIL